MASYIILGSEDLSFVRAFSVLASGYNPSRQKRLNVQRTVTGDLDVQVSPIDRIWQYVLKVSSVAAQATASAAHSGSYTDADSYSVTGAGTDWTYPDEVMVSDGTYGGLLLTGGAAVSKQNKVTGFNADIPEGVVITGIKAAPKVLALGTDGDIGITLCLPLADAGTVSVSCTDGDEEEIPAGGPAYLWGELAIDPDDVNDDDFGVELTLGTDGDGSLVVDYINITVYYDVFDSTVQYGDLDDLKQLFDYNLPGANKLWFQDVDGSIHRVLLTGNLAEKIAVTLAGGIASRYDVPVSIMQWEEVT